MVSCKRFRILSLLVFVVTFVSCNKDDKEQEHENNSQATVSSITIAAGMDSSTQGINKENWSKGDKIGVFISDSLSSKLLYSNVEYSNLSTFYLHMFAQTNSKVKVDEGEAIIVSAYYPYTPNMDNDRINVNLTNQNSGKDYDLMLAKTKVNYSNEAIQMYFEHQLTILDVTITDATSKTSLIPITISGAFAEGKLNGLTQKFEQCQTKDIKINGTNNRGIIHFSAYIIPNNLEQQISFNFELNGQQKSIRTKLSQCQKGKKYNFNYNFNGDSEQPSPSKYSACLEIPAISEASNYVLINHYEPLDNNNNPRENKNVRNYSYLFDKNLKIAKWVAYPLHSYYLGTTKRPKPDPWHYDYALGIKWQDNVWDRGYSSNGMRCDRGHQLPSADRLKNLEYNRTTFVSANCTAQSSNLNQGVWQELESKVRAYQKSLKGVGLDTLYVVTGAEIGSYPNMPKIKLPTVKDANGKVVTVPSYYYKALAIRTKDGGFETMAFVLPNMAGIGRNDYNNYRITVKQLESYTGFKFFPNIPDSFKNSNKMTHW
ncbi:MAG: DNA/RNA non-specific endonuclease [Porphyromonadaceae bacterium]|nr:DNA/RNA non-specific endonuclease [Porphyromonadaceae bacterium]